ncbi:MAG: MATE family efflux transporter [Clostridia bacterium]|nr:MATE family efflux transporter [Clostridia bacterium]
MKRRTDVDMTEGSIFGHLLTFAFPLLLGNLFQQFYNTVDTWVVGNYVSNEAFSAVGTVGPIVNMLIGFFLGFSNGAGVVISQYYGAKNFEKVKKTVHTSIVLTLLLGIVLTVIGIIMVPYMLTFMKMPDGSFEEGITYLTIYFSGLVGLMFYNLGSGILRAVGDSQRPFYFLVVSALLNVALDLLFVIKFGMGVEGVAYATVISQTVSAILCFIVLFRTSSCVRISIRNMQIDRECTSKIVKIGIPSALQMTITSFSNVFVQSYINYFGTDCMSGWTAYAKLDAFMFLPMQSISLATTTFVGQNLGKNDVARAKKGVNVALLMSFVATFVIMLPMVGFAPHLVYFFNQKQTVIEYGTLFLRYITPFYLICCVNQIYAGALRGAGNTRASMYMMLASFVFFRQGYLFIMANFISNTVLPIAMAYPAGWLVCSLLNYLYYKRVDLAKTRVV